MVDSKRSPRRRKGMRTIAVLIEDNGVMRVLLSGLYRYALDRPDWMIWYGPLDSYGLKRSTFDAAISIFETPESLEYFTTRKIPVLSVFRSPKGLAIPTVGVDHEAVGRMACQYFLSRGLTSLAYVGNIERPKSHRVSEPVITPQPVETLRLKGYREFAAGRSVPVAVAPPFWPYNEASRKQHIEWLHSLPKPVGLFCLSDQTARLVADICRVEAIPVPGHVAILGVNNELRHCEVILPALSSIAIPWELLGEELGHMLDELFSVGRVKSRRVLIPPSGIVERASTGTAPVTDPIITKALARLHERAYGSENLKEIFAHFPLCRRHLNRRFHEVTGRTLLTELWMLRVERAKFLLQSTSRTLSDIATASGFTDRRQMARVVERVTGKTVRTFRS